MYFGMKNTLKSNCNHALKIANFYEKKKHIYLYDLICSVTCMDIKKYFFKIKIYFD